MMRWEVSHQESGMKLLAFLKTKLPEYSTRHLKRSIEDNRCQVNGRTERFASSTLSKGDQIEFELSEHLKLGFELERILYEDADLLIYNKPAHVVSDSQEFLDVLQTHCKPLILVHRLDRDTTGALIFAKSEAAADKMLELFRAHAVIKHYLAIVDKAPKQISGTIDNYLAPKHRYQGQTIYGASSKGQHALTQWKRIVNSKEASLLLCQPKTGRTHQLRVHLSEMGHPILGDYQYGRQFISSYRPANYLLHALSVEFLHPTTQQKLFVQAPVSDQFETALKTLFGKDYEEIFNH